MDTKEQNEGESTQTKAAETDASGEQQASATPVPEQATAQPETAEAQEGAETPEGGKKLKLSKESLKELDEAQLDQVAGGQKGGGVSSGYVCGGYWRVFL